MRPEEQSAYQAALQVSAYRLLEQPGYLRLAGPDRTAFLQRQTTNDVRQVVGSQTLLTVLITPTARILDVLYLVDEGEALGVITLSGRGSATFRYLKSRIFFMDKVTLSEHSLDYAQIDLEGPQAAITLEQMGMPTLPARHAYIAAEITGGGSPSIALRVAGQAGIAGVGYRLLLPVADLPALQAGLHALDCPALLPGAAETLRIEAGLPAAGAELNEDYTPLEIGLRDSVADNKGCYTGQEVIARQLTYDKVTQHLAGLRLQTPAQNGWRVYVDGKPAGEITSAADSPRFGSIALAVLRRPHHQPGTPVSVGSPAVPGGLPAGATPGVVCELPFQP